MRTTYEVRVERGERWWVITVPKVRGALSQARRLADVERMARDAIALVLNVRPTSFDVVIECRLPKSARAAVARLDSARTVAAATQRALGQASTAAAVALVDAGLPLRDAAEVLGVSFQRVGQLTSAAKRTSA